MPDNMENDIIEMDNEAEYQEKIPESGIYPYSTEYEIDLKEEVFTIFEYMRKYDRGDLIINPEFQRNLVWKIEQKSCFIESCILGFPLPPFFVNQRQDGKYIIIDGLQRTTTIRDFLKDEFKLIGLEALPQLNDKKFSELDKLQSKIEDKKLFIYNLKPSVPSRVIHDLFKRLNTGGTPLNRQEVRHCIYMGKSTRLLTELADTDYFKKAIDNGISPKRMKDKEAVLRVIAFYLFDYKKYDDSLSDFLEKAMKQINSMEENKIDELKNVFKWVMEKTFDLFGDKNFRYPTENGRGQINMAMMEAVCYFFLKKKDKFLNDNKRRIIRNFKLLLNDQEFTTAVRFSTGTLANVMTRFKKAQSILGDIS